MTLEEVRYNWPSLSLWEATVVQRALEIEEERNTGETRVTGENDEACWVVAD